MTLIDTDKGNEDRGTPTPNSSDSIAEGQRMAHQTASSHYKPEDETSTARLQQIGKTFIANNGVTNKASFGYNAAIDDWGLFVADDGIDVMTNTDPSNLIFNSSQDVFKIVKTGFITTQSLPLAGTAGTWASNTVSTVIAHGLSFTPVVLGVLFTTSGNYTTLPLTELSNRLSTAPLTISYSLAADGTNLTLNYSGQTYFPTTDSVTYSVPVTAKYFLLQETAN